MDRRPLAMPDETVALVALLRAARRPRTLYADLLEDAGSAVAVLEEEQGLMTPQLLEDAATEIAFWNDEGIRAVTLLDCDYPPNLRAVQDRPPLLFVRGQLAASNARSVAVIGSRRASPTGLDRARAITEELIEAGYTVVSGLAAGVDTAAHRTTLGRGGRTIAVIGTGLLHAYPPENEQLQDEIATHGAVISQFWPETRPERRNFPVRNALMSGMALATFVVEATHMSGARTQVRAALSHGRPVLLADALLDQQWARELVARPGVYPIGPSGLPEVLARLTATDSVTT